MRGLTFEPAGHRYVLDGRPEVSVTGVLKWAGLIRLGGIPEPVLERARQRGTDVHTIVQYDNDGALDECSVDDEYRGYLDAWRRFRREATFRPVLSERRLASRRYRVCGTLDAIGTLDGVGAIVDAKTGSPDDVAADLQTAAYEGLAREWAALGEDHELALLLNSSPFLRIQRVAVQLRRDGTFSVECYTAPTDWTHFVTLVSAYHIAEARGAELRLEDVAEEVHV
jgi:hypothetical protein